MAKHKIFKKVQKTDVGAIKTTSLAQKTQYLFMGTQLNINRTSY